MSLTILKLKTVKINKMYMLKLYCLCAMTKLKKRLTKHSDPYVFIIYLGLQCPPLDRIANAVYTDRRCASVGSYVNQSCEILCHPNYDLIGISTLFCNETGLWDSTTLPECQRRSTT